MNYTQSHIPHSKSKRPGNKMNPTTITIHSTANPNSTARNERNWLTNPSNNRTASYHIVVDEKEAIEVLPLNEISYHAGNRTGNNSSIGIEICESGNRQKTLKNAVELTAKMLHQRNWGVDKLRRHFDWSGKICPGIMHDRGRWTGWIQFKKDVDIELKKLKGGNNMSNTANNNNNIPSGWAKARWGQAIKDGVTDGTRPKDPATREEIVEMIYRAMDVAR